MLTVRLQSTTWRRGSRALVAVLALCQAVVVVQAFGAPGEHRGTVIGFALVTSFGLGLLLYRLFLRPAVYADADGLRVVNPLRTYVVSWPDLDAIEFGRHTSGRVQVVARCVDGRQIALTALAVPVWREREPERSDAAAKLSALMELAGTRVRGSTER